MAMLRCQGLAKAFGSRTVLSDIDLTVLEGTLTAILGASGSGKTTLLRVVIGFLRADAGAVTVGDLAVARAPDLHLAPERRAIGYVAQEGALFPHLSAGENVAFGLPRHERKTGSRVGEALELVGLDASYSPRRPHELSGGEQRRVALARALAARPEVVLLDEPFSGLDAALRVETREAVLRALAEQGTTAMLVTHDQAEALSMGREVAVLRDGRLVQTAAPAVLYRTPVDLELARFVGEAVVLPGQAHDSSVTCALGDLPLLRPGLFGEVDVMIRPEQIRLARPSAPAVPDATRRATATVVGHTFYGPDTVLRLSMSDADVATTLTARTIDPDVPDVGEVVDLVVVGPIVAYQAKVPLGPGALTLGGDLEAEGG
jgi:iron(III) transport system ATP-binding protein